MVASIKVWLQLTWLMLLCLRKRIWKNSGRFEHYTQDGTMLITESNKGTFCLAPTGEEAMLEFAREKLNWTPKYSDVHTLLESTWNAYQKNMNK